MERQKQRVLIVDDNEISLRILKHYLVKNGFKVYSTQDPEEGLAELLEIEPDLCIFDNTMYGTTGVALCSKVKAKMPDLPVILYSGSIEVYDQFFAQLAGVDDFILKDGMMDNLSNSIKKVLSK